MGGSSTKTKTSTEYPDWYTDIIKSQTQKAEDISKLGYVPYMGPEVAAFAPQQVDAMQQAANWSAAFGGPGAQAVDVAANMPQVYDYGGGLKGHSSFPGYLDQVEAFKQMYPGQASYIESFVINPYDAPPDWSPVQPGSGQPGELGTPTNALAELLTKKEYKKLPKDDRSNYFSYGGKYYNKDTYSDWYDQYYGTRRG